MQTNPSIKGLRRAALKYSKLSDWLSNEPEPRARDRELWRGARIVSGLGRELWAVRVWAAREAALYVARQIAKDNVDHVARAICWLASNGTGGGFVDPGAGTTRCVPSTYLDTVYAYACTATDAAGAPRFPVAPLYRRNALGGQVWDEAFIAASHEFYDGVTETGLEILAGLTETRYSVYARNGQHILLARKMHSIAKEAMEEESQPRPQRWDIVEYTPGCWDPVQDDSGPYKSREEASEEAKRLTDEALRNMLNARAAARKALGLDPEPREVALDAIGASE